jgi:hypothetical protein
LIESQLPSTRVVVEADGPEVLRGVVVGVSVDVVHLEALRRPTDDAAMAVATQNAASEPRPARRRGLPRVALARVTTPMELVLTRGHHRTTLRALASWHSRQCGASSVPVMIMGAIR